MGPQVERDLMRRTRTKDIDTLKTTGIAVTTPARKPFKDIVLAAYPELLGSDPRLNAISKRFLDLQK